MNAPLPDEVRRALESVTLDDKYSLARGRAFMSGVQALVRLPMHRALKVEMIDHLGEADFRLSEGGNPELQMEALLARCVLSAGRYS